MAVLQNQRAGALPGQSIVVLDPQSMLVLDLFCAEDAHAQERSLCPQMLTHVRPREVWIADRNVQLQQPTRHGDTQVVILTQLPTAVADAPVVANLYLERWSIEGLFQVITDVFHCEIKTLGYPGAALFVFAMAVVAFNIFSTLKAALKSVHGVGKIEAGLSDFYLVEEVQGTFRGMMIALPAPIWQPFAHQNVETFAHTLKHWAIQVDLKRFASAPRGSKKPKTQGVYDPKHPHVSTARLLEQKKNNRSP